MPDLSVLEERWAVDESTVRPVAEGVWFAWRHDRDGMSLVDIRNGVWWLEDGSKVVSLGMGSGLHYHKNVDWETYVFRPAGVDIDVCCHSTEAEAEKCALTFFATGQWCREPWTDDAD